MAAVFASTISSETNIASQEKLANANKGANFITEADPLKRQIKVIGFVPRQVDDVFLANLKMALHQT